MRSVRTSARARLAAVALLGLAAGCASADAEGAGGANAAPPALTCAGAMAQGGLAVCRGAPGAQVRVDGVARGPADGNGFFVVGFDRDSGPEAVVEAGAAKTTLTIAPREFSVQRIDGLPRSVVTPTDPQVLERIRKDAALKKVGFASRAKDIGYLDGFVWPTQGRLSGPWGNQRVLNGEPKTPHYGMDIAAPVGAPIRAPAAGVVSLAEPDLHFEGGLVLLDHGQGLISMYLHMSKLDVAAGESVGQGETLGAVGKEGRATGPHLCWRLKWRDRNLDPALAMSALAEARAKFGLGPAPEPGAAPAGFSPWTARP